MLTTPPLSLEALTALKELGICILEDLQEIDAVRIFLLPKASSLIVTRSTLWQLDALVSSVDVRHIPEEGEAKLDEASKDHPPAVILPL